MLVFFFNVAQVSATPFASLIMDVRSGEILQSSNATARLHPASLTKMMTLYIVFEAIENGEIDVDARVSVSAAAARQPPSRLGLREGQTIALRYLIRAAALRSGNDAAVALAEAIEGSVPNFARRMNRTARAIGMTRTNFINPNGLTEAGHLSTARDMSILARQLYFDFPQYYGLFSRLSEDAGIVRVRNTNRRFLNGYRGADGIKTGFTNAAGYNLAAMAERDGVRLLVIVMGARSTNDRYERTVALMDSGFRLAPRRAATRRPSRPDYVRAPEDSGSGVSAGRVIRLQTAPRRSRFPSPRPPRPDEAPAAELVAALRDEIDSVIDEIRAPDPAPETMPETMPETVLATVSDTVAEAADEPTEGQLLLAAVAPEISLVPVPRPDAVDAPDDQPAQVSRTANVSTRDAGMMAEMVEGVAVAPDVLLPPLAPPQGQFTPVPLDHPRATIGAISVAGGLIVIPGLPPIVVDPEAARDGATSSPPLPPAPVLEPAEGALAVSEDGRILWRDEEILLALVHEDPVDPVLARTIVLTTSGTEDTASAPPMPEIVTRVSTSGGRVWAVQLGQFASRFDAERTLLRLALSEAGTLGAGVRRVTARGSQFVAEIHSLTQEDATLACTRLVARNHACSLIDP